MTLEQQAILTRCLALQAEIEANQPHAWNVLERREWEIESAHGPRYLAGRWFGPLHERERMRYRRAIDVLERDRLVVTHREWGGKLTNVALTAAGEDVARQLAESSDA